MKPLRSSHSSRLGKALIQTLGVAAFAAVSAEAASISLAPSDYAFIINSAAHSPAVYENLDANGTLLGGSLHGGYAYGEASLLKFDVSSLILPDDAQITGISLTLTAAYSYSYSNGEVLHFSNIAEANAAWQGGSTDNRKGVTGAYLDQTSYTNVNTHTGVKWASGSLFGRTGDLGTEVGSRAFSSIVANTTYSFDLDIGLIDYWLQNPTAAQAGLAMYMTNNESTAAASRFIYFYSDGASVDAALLPRLTVEYEVVPEPGTVAAIVMGGLLLAGARMRRNRD